MVTERSPALRGQRPSVSILAALLLLPALLLPAGCLSPPPSRESAPNPVPLPPPSAPAPAEPAPTEAPAEAAPATAPTTEGKASAGAESEIRTPAADDARRDRSVPARPAASKRARGADEEAPNEQLGGSSASPQKPAALRAQLDRAERAATPDCPSARERSKAVCDLAGQICRLTDRDPNVASVAEYCADAKQRCSDAERRTAERCPD